MTDCTAAIIATALNTAWNVAGSGFAKPLDGIGGSGFTTTIYENFQNLIELDEPGGRAPMGGGLRQKFRIWFAHPVDGALNYCITLILALTAAGTVVLEPSKSNFDGTNYYAVLELVTMQ